MQRYLRIKLEGIYPMVDRVFKGLDEEDAWSSLTSDELNIMLKESYRLSTEGFDWNSARDMRFPQSKLSKARKVSMRKKGKVVSKNPRRKSNDLAMSVTTSASELHHGPSWNGARHFQVLFLLHGLRKINPQFDIDGIRNLWVVKAPEACQGVNLKILHKCEDIIECERGMGGRTIQKYIEAPLLYAKGPNNGQYKFDLRIWVLLTSVTPLKAHVYSRVYGRLCSRPYSCSPDDDGDAHSHFTNFSINKNDKGKGKGGSSTGQELLLTHAEVLNRVETRARSLRRYQPEKYWLERIWPVTCYKLSRCLEMAVECGNLVHRPRSFEFLGFDVMLDNDLNPWVLEVNMSPAMAHRDEAHDAMVRAMASGLLDRAVIEHTGEAPEPKVEPVQGTFGLKSEKRNRPNKSNSNQSNNLKSLVNENANDTSSTHSTDGHTDDASSDGSHDGFDLPSPSSSNIKQKSTGTEINKKIIDHWEVLVRQKQSPVPIGGGNVSQTQRPRSASATGRPGTAGSGRNRVFDVTFAAVGCSISGTSMTQVDRIAVMYQKRDLLGRWMKRYLERTRVYHKKRHFASCVMQCFVRCFVARRRVWHRRRFLAAISIQCAYRTRQAFRRYTIRRHLCAAQKMHRLARQWLAVRKVEHMRQLRAASVIRQWHSYHTDRYLRKKAFIISWRARGWINRRKKVARKVLAIIGLYYRRRRRRAIVIQKCYRRFIVRRNKWRFMRSRILRKLAIEAKTKLKHIDAVRVKRHRRELYEELLERFSVPPAAQPKLRDWRRECQVNPREDNVAMNNQISPRMIDGEEEVILSKMKGRNSDVREYGNLRPTALTASEDNYLFDYVDRYKDSLNKIKPDKGLRTSAEIREVFDVLASHQDGLQDKLKTISNDAVKHTNIVSDANDPVISITEEKKSTIKPDNQSPRQNETKTRPEPVFEFSDDEEESGAGIISTQAGTDIQGGVHADWSTSSPPVSVTPRNCNPESERGTPVTGMFRDPWGTLRPINTTSTTMKIRASSKRSRTRPKGREKERNQGMYAKQYGRNDADAEASYGHRHQHSERSRQSDRENKALRSSRNGLTIVSEGQSSKPRSKSNNSGSGSSSSGRTKNNISRSKLKIKKKECEKHVTGSEPQYLRYRKGSEGVGVSISSSSSVRKTSKMKTQDFMDCLWNENLKEASIDVEVGTADDNSNAHIDSTNASLSSTQYNQSQSSHGGAIYAERLREYVNVSKAFGGFGASDGSVREMERAVSTIERLRPTRKPSTVRDDDHSKGCEFVPDYGTKPPQDLSQSRGWIEPSAPSNPPQHTRPHSASASSISGSKSAQNYNPSPAANYLMYGHNSKNNIPYDKSTYDNMRMKAQREINAGQHSPQRNNKARIIKCTASGYDLDILGYDRSGNRAAQYFQPSPPSPSPSSADSYRPYYQFHDSAGLGMNWF